MSEVVQFAGRVLGPCTVVADCSWEHRMSAVLRLRDQQGTGWFVKRHSARNRYETEVMAYHAWVPALGGQAPALRDPRRRAECPDHLSRPRYARALAGRGPAAGWRSSAPGRARDPLPGRGGPAPPAPGRADPPLA
jgi:hypothetical protein